MLSKGSITELHPQLLSWDLCLFSSLGRGNQPHSIRWNTLDRLQAMEGKEKRENIGQRRMEGKRERGSMGENDAISVAEKCHGGSVFKSILATFRLDYSISAHTLYLLAKRSSFEMAQKTISAALSIPPTT